MPTYDYICKKCQHTFEAFQRITDSPITDCPKCGLKNSVKRLIGGGSGIIFKGSGFYANDYKKSNPPEKKPIEKSPCRACPSKGCGVKKDS